MAAKWKSSKKLKPEIIISEIQDAITNVNDDGTVSFKVFEIEDCQSALASMISFNCEISETNKSRILIKAISSAARLKKLNKDGLLEEINLGLRNHFSQRETNYYLLTSISLADPLPIKSVDVLGHSIRLFNGNYPGKYSSRSEIESEWRGEKDHTPAEYSKAIVRVKAKSIYEASDTAIDAIDLLRSAICILSNSSMTLSLGGSDHHPINKVMLGGVHTLHLESGKRVDNCFWFEPNFEKIKPLSIKEEHLPIETKNYRWMLERLSLSPYKEKLKEAMLRYVRAFDERDKNTVIQKAWGALEALTAAGENSYDLIPKRCSFFYVNRDYHRQILEHLREYRNQTIHAGEYASDAQVQCYQIQRYFRGLILFHLRNADFFTSLDEANMYLDLPTEIKTLQRKRDLIDKAIKFLTPSEK